MASQKNDILIVVLIFSVCCKTISAFNNGKGINNPEDENSSDDDVYDVYIDYASINNPPSNKNDEGTSNPVDFEANLNIPLSNKNDEGEEGTSNLVDFVVNSNIPSSSFNDERSSNSTHVNVTVPDYDSINFHPASPAAWCLLQIGKQCERGVISKESCAREGVRSWPKGKIVPYFVVDYFNQYKFYLNAGPFYLPSEFCLLEAYDKSGLSVHMSFEEMEEMIRQSQNLSDPILHDMLEKDKQCNRALRDFRAQPRTLVIAPILDLDQFTQQMRQDILLYGFYEAKNVPIAWNSYSKLYLLHMSDHITVNDQMDSPKAYCLKLTDFAY